MSRILFVILLALTTLVGCNQKNHFSGISVGGPTGMTSWWMPIEPGKPSPFDEGRVCYVGKLFVVWCDAGSGSGIGGSVGAYHGSLKLRDGSIVDFRGKTTDGSTGTVTIDGQTCDLSAGRLILLSGQGGRLRAKQLQRDLSPLNYQAKALQDYGRGDPEIAEFFGEPKTPQ